MADKFSISQVIEFYTGTPVHQRGSGWSQLCCPVHDESNPSASFNEDLGKIHCFGCTFHGDALDLIEKKEGITNYSEKVTRAEEITGQKLDGASSLGSKLPSRRLPARISDGGLRPVQTAGGDPASGAVPRAVPAGRRRPRRIVN